MNGGNRQRGQADGFSIDILPKIKDVKSNNNSSNLLAYIVRLCIVRYDEQRGTQEAALPVPEPSDLEKCQHIDFDVERGECEKVKRQLEKAKSSTTKIFEQSPEELREPFQGHMVAFLTSAEGQLGDLGELLEDCQRRFLHTMRFYKFMPKMGKLEEAKPADFFCLWFPFCQDYKNLWKKEQVRVQREMLKEERQRHKKKKESLQNVEIKKTPAGGLKAKLQRRKTQSSAVSGGSPLLEDKVREEEGGLKAKLMKRKAKSASAASGSSTMPGTEVQAAGEGEGLKARLARRSRQREATEELVEETEAMTLEDKPTDSSLKDDPDFF